MFLIELIISGIIVVSSYLYILSDTLNKKINVKSFTTLLWSVISIFCIALNFYVFDSYIRVLFNFLTVVITCKFIFKETISKSTSSCFVLFIYFFLAEIIFGLILTLFLNVDAKSLEQTWAGGIWSNLLISLIAIAISDIKFIKVFFQRIINAFENVKHNEFFIFIMFVIGILSDKNSIFLGINVDYIMNLILTLVFIYIIFHFFKEKTISNQLSDKYDHLFDYIQKYEYELNQKNMLIHEYKNQIIAIKGFIGKSNKKANSFLEGITKDFNNAESKTLKDMENLPKGGLKGLIYYKLGSLANEKIDVYTNINENIKKFHISNKNQKFYQDFIKLTGVFLDNAIESARSSQKKQIILEIYCEGKEVVFVLSNTYDGPIDINKFYNSGFSTKGSGRGYGLSVAKQIIDKYGTTIKQEINVVNEYYVLKLKVDLKNIPA